MVCARRSALIESYKEFDSGKDKITKLFKKELSEYYSGLEDLMYTDPYKFLSMKTPAMIDQIEWYSNYSLTNKAYQYLIDLNNLCWCSKLKDVSALGNVHTLNLSDCIKIKDVSALGRVHTLLLINYRKIKDVSALGRVHSLNLQN